MSDPSSHRDPSVEATSDLAPEAPPGGDGATAGVADAPKADLVKRFLAFLIDGVIAAIVSRIPWIGGILAALYILFRDGFDYEFMDHRSLGKRIMRLRPLCDDGSPVTFAVSAARNWTLVVTSLAVVLVLIPILGWLLIPRWPGWRGSSCSWWRDS